ncbi:MAG TPA: 50S ribosomal protein L10 [Syntrophales bacterium]|nr:50S ribosomal protein L10 [Syntrophales bacterium]HOL58901.1 50S ribosomal protein L10 [Syntrophales bacterium]HPO35228.1 50S ribosomal protein L10 [Syntrophales bacterium]
MDRKEKAQVVQELHERLKDFNLAVLAEYSGLDVERMTALRRGLRNASAEMRVVKNTLLRIASEGTQMSVLRDYLKGPLALVLTSGDPVEAAKVLSDFAKKNAELNVKIGVLGGRLLTKDELEALAQLPSREVLLGKLLSVMVAAQGSLVHVLSAVPRSFVQVLHAYREKKEKLN